MRGSLQAVRRGLPQRHRRLTFRCLYNKSEPVTQPARSAVLEGVEIMQAPDVIVYPFRDTGRYF